MRWLFERAHATKRRAHGIATDFQGPPMFFLFRRAPTVLPAAFLVLATGCTWTPPAAPQSGADPADAQVQVRPVIDTGVIGPYQSLRPVTPGSWREQNERVAPQPQP